MIPAAPTPYAVTCSQVQRSGLPCDRDWKRWTSQFAGLSCDFAI